MRIKAQLIFSIIFLGLLNFGQVSAAPAGITFNSFNGLYNLSRDANNVSLLTSEEVIVADFPGNGNFSGITRSIPETYQGHDVEVKVLGVTDAAGSPLPYKTSPDGNNLVVTTGDPAITLYGSQTFRISYQTTGVIDIKPSGNTFLLDINGRGWSAPFGSVSGTLILPKSLVTSLRGDPGCYIGYLKSKSGNCQVTTAKTPTDIRITAKASGAVLANNTLVITTSFKTATFQQKKPSNYLIPALAVILLFSAGTGLLLRRFNTS
jgi:hypothetical protein